MSGLAEQPDGSVTFFPSPRLRAMYLFLLILAVWIGILPWLILAVFTLPAPAILNLVIPILVAVMAFRWWIPRYWASLEFRVTTGEMVISKGVWFRRQEVVPLMDVREITISCGFFCRQMGIASLVLTRPGKGRPVRIPGMEEAEKVRGVLERRVKAGRQ